MAFGIVLLGYLLGSIPSGILLARAFSLPDPRGFASGNIGASNLTRLGGKKIGFLTLLCDALKVVLPLLAALFLFPGNSQLHAAIAVAGVFGHCVPVFLKFKGGKGVATSAGALFVLAPLPSVVGLAVWLALFFWKRITSLAALGSSATVPIAILFYQGIGPIFYAACGITLLVFVRHSQNIQSLLRGTERSFR